MNEEQSKIERRIAELIIIFKFLKIEHAHPATGLLEEANRRLKHFLRPQPPVRKLKKDGILDGTDEVLDLAEVFLRPGSEDAVARYREACARYPDRNPHISDPYGKSPYIRAYPRSFRLGQEEWVLKCLGRFQEESYTPTEYVKNLIDSETKEGRWQQDDDDDD